jgi:hypothetical protein
MPTLRVKYRMSGLVRGILKKSVSTEWFYSAVMKDKVV